MTATREREWMIPCAIMTALLGAAAVALMPVAGYSDVPPYFGRFLNWLFFSAVGAIGLLAAYVLKLARAGIDAPISHIVDRLRSARTAAAVAGMVLAGIDMLFFMWIKPEVTAVSPFWADELWADIDHSLFLGRDPWRFFEGLDLSVHAWAYSFFWAVAIMATLLWLFIQRPSRERSASIVSYFALWSIFGPIGQMLGSSAGPIFYRRIGLGDRFVELEANIPEVTRQVSSYLWHFHTAGQPAAGAGISAMPSLHIATVTWIYFVFRGQSSRLAPIAAIFGLYIFALSVALGWHYAVDGIAAAVGALLCQRYCRAWLESETDAKTAARAIAVT